MGLEIVTFTGVDTGTDKDRLSSLFAEYPKMEIGVLVVSHSGEADYGIFPPLPFVESVPGFAAQSAIHLCGRYSRAVMDMDPGIPFRSLVNLCAGFDRVQINLHGDAFNAKAISVAREAVVHFAEECTADHIILQHRKGWIHVPVRHPKVEYLFDRSEGAGRVAFHEWPKPLDDGVRYGFAGGIGPDTIDDVMPYMAMWSNCRLWIDMEGRVRTAGMFDLDKIEAVCRRVWGRHGRKQD